VDIKNTTECQLKLWSYGASVITIPSIPIIVTIHSLSDTFSFKNIGAKIKMNIGIVKLIMVAVVSCEALNPFIHRNIATAKNDPRIKCKSGLELLIDLMPLYKINGIKLIVPKKNLKNDTSNEDMLSHRNFASTSFILLINKLNINQPMPIKYCMNFKFSVVNLK
jgi:hypothetical protein